MKVVKVSELKDFIESIQLSLPPDSTVMLTVEEDDDLTPSLCFNITIWLNRKQVNFLIYFKDEILLDSQRVLAEVNSILAQVGAHDAASRNKS